MKKQLTTSIMTFLVIAFFVFLILIMVSSEKQGDSSLQEGLQGSNEKLQRESVVTDL